MPLAKFEFNLYKNILQLEDAIGVQGKRILLNLQISGGKDSMTLLHAINSSLSFSKAKLKNQYILIAQHFNHNQRGIESDEDASFVCYECLKLGIPIYSEILKNTDIPKNKQNYFRNWRKANAVTLSENISKKLNCDQFFIVTAHHARDNVETVLLHILRGSGLDGLKGISLLNDNQIYFRPYYNVLYAEIEKYVEEFQIKYREDSSNLVDIKYSRNYLRHHVIPHLKKLNPEYERAFLTLSKNASQVNNEINKKEYENNFVLVTPETTSQQLQNNLKLKYNLFTLSKNSIDNILHECHILFQSKIEFKEKLIQTKHQNTIRLTKRENIIEIKVNHT
jgi:tRNA(Ile)-lysidine synthase